MSELLPEDLVEIIKKIQEACEKAGKRVVLGELLGPDGAIQILIDNREEEDLQ